jgi:hypothetical protein
MVRKLSPREIGRLRMDVGSAEWAEGQRRVMAAQLPGAVYMSRAGIVVYSEAGAK